MKKILLSVTLLAALIACWLIVSPKPPVALAQSQTAFRFMSGASLPATCRIADVFYKTASVAGQYNCTSLNTWTLAAAAGGSSITGSGAANQVTLWSASTTLAGDPGFTYTTSPVAFIVTSTAAGLRGIEAYQYSTDATSALFLARKARGTSSVPTDVAVSDILSSYQTDGYLNGAFRTAGAVQVIVTSTTSNLISAKLRFAVANAGTSTSRWDLMASGELDAVTDNSYDIGNSSGNRPRTVYAGTSMVTQALWANIVAVTFAQTPYAVLVTDFTILCDASSGNVTITLPDATTNQGRILNMKKTDATANSCTLSRSGSDTIDGATTKATSTQYVNFQLQAGGAAWNIL